MFLGTYTPKLDEKGRFFLPAKFRDELSDGLVITVGQDRCLVIYPLETFAKVVQQFVEAPSTVAKVRNFQRMIAANASDETPDRQGRLTIPPNLRRYAGLEKEIVVVGSINRLEVWDQQAWERFSDEQESAYADMNEEVFPGL